MAEENRLRNSQEWHKYLLGFLLAVAGLPCAVLALSTTDWFTVHCAYKGFRSIGYGQRDSHGVCDVLIYGDSTAEAGLDPRILRKVTGRPACNISEWSVVLQVVGSEAPLDAYLRHHLPPRVLVTSWSARNFRPVYKPLTGYSVEGVWYAWRFGAWKQLLGRRFLYWTTKYIAWSTDSLMDGLFSAGGGTDDPLKTRAARLGQWPFPKPPQTSCLTPAVHFPTETWAANVAAFRQRYEAKPMRVLVDVSPVPDCDALFGEYRVPMSYLPDNHLEVLPVSMFNDGDVHLGAQGSELFSRQVGLQVLHLLRAPTGDGGKSQQGAFSAGAGH